MLYTRGVGNQHDQMKRFAKFSYLAERFSFRYIQEAVMDNITIRDIVEVTGGRAVPEWLEADSEKLEGTVKEVPTREVIDVPVNEMLIVELYSK